MKEIEREHAATDISIEQGFAEYFAAPKKQVQNKQAKRMKTKSETKLTRRVILMIIIITMTRAVRIRTILKPRIVSFAPYSLYLD